MQIYERKRTLRSLLRFNTVLERQMSLPSGSVSRDIFIRKLILFVDKRSRITLGFLPAVCHNLFKYKLHDIVNNHVWPKHNNPSKFERKSRVKNAILRKETYLWDQGIAADSDFTFFSLKVCNRSLCRNTAYSLASILPADEELRVI